MQPFVHPNNATYKIWSRLAIERASEIFTFESVDDGPLVYYL